MDLNSDGQACEKESSISGSNDQSGDAGSQPHGDLLHSKTATSTDDVVALPSSKDSGHAALQNHLAGPSPSTPASAYTESPASEYFDCIPHPPPPPHNIGMPARAFHHDPANAIVFNSPSKEIVGTPFSDLTTDGIHTRFEYPFPSPAVGVVTDAPSPALTTASTTSSTSSLHSPLAGVLPSSSSNPHEFSHHRSARSVPELPEMLQYSTPSLPLLLKNPPELQLKPVARGFTEPPMPPSLKEKIRKRASVGHVVVGLGLRVSTMDGMTDVPPTVISSERQEKED